MWVDLPEAVLQDIDPERLGPGLYVAPFNFSWYVEGLILHEYPFSPEMWPENRGRDDIRQQAIHRIMEDKTPYDYGVCDDPQQVLDKWPELATDERRYMAIFVPVCASKQEDQGWRWHKNGPYIGTQEPQYEYIGDEPLIELVYMFNIVELREDYSIKELISP